MHLYGISKIKGETEKRRYSAILLCVYRGVAGWQAGWVTTCFIVHHVISSPAHRRERGGGRREEGGGEGVKKIDSVSTESWD